MRRTTEGGPRGMWLPVLLPMLLTALLASPVPALEPPPPSAAATPPDAADATTAPRRLVEALEELEPYQVGTDREGHLWSWSRKRGRVVLFDAAGREARRWTVPGAGAVDVDAEWGVVALGPRGRQLLRPGTEAPPLALELEARNLAWIAADRVAVLPAVAAHRVVILNLATGEAVRRLDEEGPVPPGPGARLARATEVEVDPRTGHLYVLDSFSGELEVFDPEAPPDRRRVRTAAAPDEGRPVFDDWLEEVDVRARERGAEQRPAVWRFHLALAPDGSAWIAGPCGDPGVARLLRVPPAGEPERVEVATPCCSTEIAVWQGHLVFQRQAGPAQEECYGAVELP